jgi:putative ABC transport system permease protein
MRIEPDRALEVLVLTLVMCWGSALIAVRKLRAADPADVF